MNILKATRRETNSTGQINKLRSEGFVPAILYGGKQNNLKISLKKLHLKNFIKTETFMSKVFDLDIDGASEKALPREVSYDPVSDEPIHIDFIRIVKGSKLVLEIPVRFINSDKSPGLKKGGVLNIVRRKVELKCPTENIPDQLVVDLENKDIGESFKISSIKLPEGVTPTIQGRDFVVATLAAPTIIKEPEKPTEEAAEGAEGAEAISEGAEGETKAAEGDKKEGDKKEPDKDNKNEGEKGKKEDKKTPTQKK